MNNGFSRRRWLSVAALSGGALAFGKLGTGVARADEKTGPEQDGKVRAYKPGELVSDALPQDVWVGSWGHWRGAVVLQSGLRVSGIAIRYEDYAPNNDDTAANGIMMYYSSWTGGGQPGNFLVEKGEWGVWKPAQMIADDEFIIGMQVKYEDYRPDNDDTAMNGLRFWARKKGTFSERPLTVWEGSWGEWKSRVNVPRGYFVAGLEAKYEPSASGNDDTALNGLRMYSFPLPSGWDVQVQGTDPDPVLTPAKASRGQDLPENEPR